MSRRLEEFAESRGISPTDAGSLILAAAAENYLTDLPADELKELGIHEGDDAVTVIEKINQKLMVITAELDTLRTNHDPDEGAVLVKKYMLFDILELL